MVFRGGSLLPQRQTSVASVAACFPEEPPSMSRSRPASPDRGPRGQSPSCFSGRPAEGSLMLGTQCPRFQEGPPHPLPHQLLKAQWGGGSRGRAAPVSLPGRVRQPPAGPVQLLTPVGHYRARICWVQRGGRAPGLFYRPVPDGRRQAPAIINPAPAALPSEDGPAPTKARQPPRSPPTLGPFPRPLPPCAGENGKAGPPGAGTADNVCLV